MHPDQETLADMMRDAGLTHVGFNNLMGVLRLFILEKLPCMKLSQHLYLPIASTLIDSSERPRFT